MKMTLALSLAVLTLGASLAFASHSTRSCATVYQGPHFSGHSLMVFNGEEISSLSGRALNGYDYSGSENWNNRISSVIVNAGCQLTVYQYNNYGRHYHTGAPIGDYKVISASYMAPSYVESLHEMNDLTSSLTCRCSK